MDNKYPTGIWIRYSDGTLEYQKWEQPEKSLIDRLWILIEILLSRHMTRVDLRRLR